MCIIANTEFKMTAKNHYNFHFFNYPLISYSLFSYISTTLRFNYKIVIYVRLEHSSSLKPRRVECQSSPLQRMVNL